MVLDIATILSQWETYGVFDYMLPFLLLFAVMFGILTATNAFGPNKAVHIIISLVVSLLALRTPFVSSFFAEVFPRTGVALAVILVAVILTAIFIPKEHLAGWAIGFYSLGAIAFVFVMFNSFSALDWFGSNWWGEWGGLLIGAILLVGVIIAISVSGPSDSKAKSMTATYGPWWPTPSR